MSIHDIVNNVLLEQSLTPQTIQASALNSGNIDCRAFGAVAIAVLVGNIADTLGASNRFDLKIEHADDDGTGNPGSYSACADDDVLNYSSLAAGVFLAVNANAMKSKRYIIGYRGGKRFVKVTATPVSLATGGPIAIATLKGLAAQKPVANT